jgi:O-antigen/teichoic acid export membrane protein
MKLLRSPLPREAGSPSHAMTVARNLSTRYLAIAVEAGLGVLILPFNVAHLGQAGYGLWALTASITAYFSVLDLGYSGALVKFVAQYRARKDERALNEILSTLFFVFVACAAAMYTASLILALHIESVFRLAPSQVHTARIVLLVISVNVVANTAFSVFGGVINGFQRYDLNNLVGTASTVITSLVNVLVLMFGFGLVELVVAMTTVRVLTLFVYRANAYRVFPALTIRAALFRRSRLREVTSFSAHMAVIDWSNRLNYSIDALVIGAFMNTSAVAVWAVAQRLAELAQRLANQLNDILFPTVVENDTVARLDRLQRIFLSGTRLSLAAAFPLAVGLALLARPLVTAWVGPSFEGSIVILRLLGAVVIVRVGSATATTILKGAGRHKLVAAASASTAVCNVALSIALIKPFGQIGVAIGTLLPVGLASGLVVFPLACRRLELPIGHAFARAVWPALWPTAVMATYAVLTLPFIPASLLATGAQFGASALVYAATFVAFGMEREERHFCLTKALAALRIEHLRPASEVS